MSPAFSADRLPRNPSTPPRSIHAPFRFELCEQDGFESTDELIVAIAPDAAQVWRDAAMLPLDAIGPALMETWWSSEPIEQIADGPITAWRAADQIVGIARATRTGDLRSTTFDLYSRILGLVHREECHLARMWNYFTDINKVEAIERYQQFCIGRFEAFERAGLDMARDLPAGSAVGSHRGNQVVVFVKCDFALAGEIKFLLLTDCSDSLEDCRWIDLIGSLSFQTQQDRRVGSVTESGQSQ